MAKKKITKITREEFLEMYLSQDMAPMEIKLGVTKPVVFLGGHFITELDVVASKDDPLDDGLLYGLVEPVEYKTF